MVWFSCESESCAERDNFVIDLPYTSKIHETNPLYEIKNKAAHELNLNLLENGVDSFELRLWTRIEATNGGQVLVIKKTNNQWVCLDYTYLISQYGSPAKQGWFDYATSFTIDTFWVSKKQPNTNWPLFLKAINKEKIYELPAQSDIEGWENRVSDGKTYCIEFANKEKYRFYWYNCPDIYEEKFKECFHMTNILKIFDTEFGPRMITGYRCLK